MIYNLCAGSGFTSAQSSLSIYAAQLSVANLAPNAGGVPTADYGINLKNKLLNIIPDMITCCMFLGFYMFWEIKSDKLTD